MMSSTHDEDPFLQVQQDVISQLDSTRPLFRSYLRIRSLSTAATSPELASARADLESALGSLAEDLADLVESVKAVESNPSQFGLDAAEVMRRKRLVQEVGGEIEDMHEELARKLDNTNKSGDRSKNQSGSVASTDDLPHPNAFTIPDGEGGGDADDNYAEFEQQQQVQMMREQDEHLDGVFQTVGNLRRQAEHMGHELEEQREMLEFVDNIADRVGGRLQNGVQKLGKVMRANEDRLSSCCIGTLIVVLIILLILLLVL